MEDVAHLGAALLLRVPPRKSRLLALQQDQRVVKSHPCAAVAGRLLAFSPFWFVSLLWVALWDLTTI